MPEALSGRGDVRTQAEPALSRAHPFAGLKPFNEEDAEWFFGRSAEINDLMKRLRRLHFVAIVGASGSGKSSLVRAGVLPHVRDGYLDADWLIATLRPGDQPMANLAQALAPMLPGMEVGIAEALHSGTQGLVRALAAGNLGENSRVLLLVDQFEELFQYAQRAGEAAAEEVKAFLKLLLAAANSDDVPIYVLITMRLEWLNECASYVGWAEAMNEGLYLVPQMSRQQFQRAILGPLELAGGAITSSLVGRMLNDLDGRSDQLPVLQHALMRLWQRCGTATPFDGPAYEAVGTIARCLSAHAEEVFAELTAPQRLATEQIFKAITQVTRNRRVRRPRPLREILGTRNLSFAEAAPVVEAFSAPGRSFLVTTQGALSGDSVIDLSHEALIRQWQRLSKWVDEEAETEARLRRMEEDAAEWNRDRKARQDCLYRGSSLLRAEELLPAVGTTSIVADFIRAGARMRLMARLRSQMMVLVAVILAGAFVFYQLHLSAERRRHEAREAQLQLDKALADQRFAAEQAKEAQAFQASVIQKIKDANGSATALASIAQSIQARRVYVQYAPGLLASAKTAQAQLQGRGYTVPGLEPVNADRAPAQSQVRYFHPEDRAGAAQIASLLSLPGASSLVANPNGVVPNGQFEVLLVPGVARTPVATTTAATTPATPPAAAPAAAPPPAQPILVAGASPNQVLAGASVRLYWQSQNASTVDIKDLGNGSTAMTGLPSTGSILVTPESTTNYTVAANGPGGTATRTVLVSVATPPPAPSAAKAAPAEPAPAVAATATAAGPLAIKAALNRYRDAYESESLDDVRRVWPTVSKAQQNNMKAIFDQFNAIRLTLNCADADIHIEGDTATAKCQQSATFTEHGKKQPVQATATTFRLRKQGESWVLVSVQ